MGHGANTDKWLRFKPNERSEPDLEINNPDNYEPLCYIEVSGSHKVNMGEGKMIWIRPDKCEETKNFKKKYWFYMKYANCTRIVDSETLQRFEDKIKIVEIKKGIKERYIEVPFNESQPEEALFDWLKEQTKGIGGDSYTQQTYFK